MNGFNFPKLFKGNRVNVIEGKECIVKQFTLLVNSELFEFRYDPGYGSNVPLLTYKPDTQLNRDLIIDAIYDLQILCPNVQFTRDNISISHKTPAVLEITVSAVMTTNDIVQDVQIYVDSQQT